jgi:hypothetical protein
LFFGKFETWDGDFAILALFPFCFSFPMLLRTVGIGIRLKELYPKWSKSPKPGFLDDGEMFWIGVLDADLLNKSINLRFSNLSGSFTYVVGTVT